MIVDYVPSPQWVSRGAMPSNKGNDVYIRSKDNADWWMVRPWARCRAAANCVASPGTV